MKIKNLITICLAIFVAMSANAQDKRTAATAYNEGFKLLKAKDYAAGLPLLEEALALATEAGDEKVMRLAKKNGAKAAYSVANTKRKAGAMDEALALYQKGIAWAPDNATNYKGIGSVYEKQGKKVEALQQYITAGDKRTAAGKADKAAKLYKKAQNMVGKIYQAKEYAKAVEAGNAYLAMRDNSEVAYYICRALTESDKAADAVAFGDKAISFAGATVDDKYRVALAKAYEKLGKNAEAIEAYKKVTGEKYKEQAEYKIKTLGSK